MPREEESKVAVVMNGKDICRIIPFRPGGGRYALKIDFLKNEFDVTLYMLFSIEPIKWRPDNSHQLEVTYHRGEDAKPLTIHLKNKTTQRYQRLPLQRIQAPGVDQLFPLPIMKLEVPSTVRDRVYKAKRYHQLISPEDCNVIEIYMAGASFDLDALEVKLPAAFFAFMMLSFEIFATNSVTTGLQKAKNILPDDRPRHTMSGVKVFDDLQLIAVHYRDPDVDHLSRINATFIENELSEAILAMMQIRYPPVSNNGEFDCIYLGGATLRDVNQPTRLRRPSIGEGNVIADALRRGLLSPEERERLYRHALGLRVRLRNALMECREDKSIESRMET